jgi:uncharacterized Zn-binding protein involved in type VI secretion
MPGAVRKPDLDSMGFVNATYSPDTFINSLNAARGSDMRVKPGQKPASDCGITVGGAEIFINNKHMQYISHPVTNGATQIAGSPNVIGN